MVTVIVTTNTLLGLKEEILTRKKNNTKTNKRNWRQILQFQNFQFIVPSPSHGGQGLFFTLFWRQIRQPSNKEYSIFFLEESFDIFLLALVYLL